MRRSKFYKLLFVVIAITSSYQVYSQILNIDRITQSRFQHKDDKNSYISISSNYTLLSQEFDLSIFTTKADFTYLIDNNALSFISNVNLTKSDNKDLVNQGYT